MSFNVDIVADSVAQTRITSVLATFPRYILAEINTHRALSRNSASSRAIPFKRMISMVWNHPFIPVKWMKDHKGMQGTVYFQNPHTIKLLTFLWLTARTLAIVVAWLLSKVGLTKQIANRLLEPFMWHTALITATEWENFISLRAEMNADIHMQIIAGMIMDALNHSTPRRLAPGEWHMPFGDNIEKFRLSAFLSSTGENRKGSFYFNDLFHETLLKIATARCARTSYLTFGQRPVKHDYGKDIQQHDDLVRNGHWSPMEHCARAMTMVDDALYGRREINPDGSTSWHAGWCGNFKGWIQYRKTFPNENRSDPRLIKKY